MKTQKRDLKTSDHFERVCRAHKTQTNVFEKSLADLMELRGLYQTRSDVNDGSRDASVLYNGGGQTETIY